MFSKLELKKQLKRFIKDPDRGISVPKFAEMCGCDPSLLYHVFIMEDKPLTEPMQIRIGRVFHDWQLGRIGVFRSKAAGEFPAYKKDEKIPLFRHMGLKVTPDGIKMDIGLRNRHDYSYTTLDEALKD